MALPTLAKTWQFDVNRVWGGIGANQDGKDIVYQVYAAITGFATNPWTLVASSDGSTAGAPGPGWADYTDCVFNSTGSARSWVVLAQPQISANCQMLITCGSAGSGTDTGRWQVKICPDGFDTSTPVVNADPPANSSRVLQTASDSGGFWYQGGNAGTSYSGKLHVMHSTDGKSTRWIVCANSVARTIGFVDVPSAVATYTPGWNEPVILGMRGWYDNTNRLTYALFNDSATGVVGWYEGAHNALFDVYLTSPGYGANNSVSAAGEVLTSPDDDTGEYPFCPMGLASETLNVRGVRRGVLNDMWWGATSAPVGSVFGVAKEFAQFGHVVFPWNGSNPAVS